MRPVPSPAAAEIARNIRRLARQFSEPVERLGLASDAQQRYLLVLIERHGLETYRVVKAELDIPYEKSITRLSRSEAWRLINRLTEAPR